MAAVVNAQSMMMMVDCHVNPSFSQLFSQSGSFAGHDLEVGQQSLRFRRWKLGHGNFLPPISEIPLRSRLESCASANHAVMIDKDSAMRLVLPLSRVFNVRRLFSFRCAFRSSSSTQTKVFLGDT